MSSTTAAFAGAAAALIATRLADTPLITLGACALTTWVLRAGSLALLRLPVYKGGLL